MGVTRKLSREGHNFQPKTNFPLFCTKGLKTSISSLTTEASRDFFCDADYKNRGTTCSTRHVKKTTRFLRNKKPLAVIALPHIMLVETSLVGNTLYPSSVALIPHSTVRVAQRSHSDATL